MIQIYTDGALAYDSRLEAYDLLGLSTTRGLNKGGSAEIIMPPQHPAYSSFISFKTIVEIYRDNFLAFRGRPLYPEDDFWNRRTITCEGEQCFLRDAVARPYDYTGTPAEVFTSVIGVYNGQVEAAKRFVVGTITVTDPNNYIRLYSETAEQISDTVDKLVERCGGYIVFTTNGQNKRVINWYASSDYRSTQTIEFGENLLDFSRSANTDIATRIIPYGAKNEETGERLTITSVNGGVDYVEDAAAVELRGVIAKPVYWDDVTVAANLKAKAQQYLADSKMIVVSLQLSAVDLAAAKVPTGKYVSVSNMIAPLNIPAGDIRTQSSEAGIIKRANFSSSSVLSPYGDYGVGFEPTSSQSSCSWLLHGGDGAGFIKPTLNPSHIYYAAVWARQRNSNVGSISLCWPDSNSDSLLIPATPLTVVDEWQKISARTHRSALAAGDYMLKLVYNNSNSSEKLYVAAVALYDLTATFGAGKEPDRAWCDENLDYDLQSVVVPDPTSDTFEVGDNIHVISTPHGVDDWMLLEEMTTNLLDPSDSTVTLGKRYDTLTGADVMRERGSRNDLQKVEQSVRADYTRDVAAAVEQATATLSSLIQQTSEMIQSTVSETYATNDQLQSAISTQFTQLSDSFIFQFSQLRAVVDDNDAEARTQFREIQKYIRFENGNILLGETGNEITLQIENDRIGFYSDGVEVAYFSNRKLYVNDGEYINSLKLGKFAFLPRNNGNLSFKKVVD